MKSINRRQFVTRMSLSAAAAVTISKLGYSAPGYFANFSRTDEYVAAEITHGKIRGIRSEGVNIFKGIPYGGRVSGDRRFRRPAPLEPWKGVRDALQLGAPAIQETRGVAAQTPAEDCLFLNVWSPANDNKKRPVMFYNHGGGFVIGSGGAPGQDGSNLARNFDVVVVETNHRLGLLGFLYLDEIAGDDYTGSGNMGILDITAGLKWVQENIAVFGGDPNNVMIFGESGGGAKTSCLYALPEAAPYFNKASIESGPGIRMTTREMAAETTAMLLKELNIAPKDWRKLLDVPATALLVMQSKLPALAPPAAPGRSVLMRSTPGNFSPVVDGVVLPNHPFDPTAPEISRNKPLMTGWNEDEYTFFAWERNDTASFKMNFDELPAKLEPQFGDDTQKIINTYRKAMPNASAPDIYIAVSSIAMMGLGSVEIAEKKAKQNGAPVYLYNFGYKSDMKIPGTDYPMGTPHAMDITFKFNNEVPSKEGEQPRMSFGGSKPDRYIASHNMAELWTTFARTGKPAAKGVPEWPAYSLKDKPTMRIDVKCEVINDRFSEELKMWRSIGRL
jgi:para-nitrobenzyl esterase